MHKLYIILSLILLIANAKGLAQRKCGTVEYMNQLGNTESKDVLENWIFQKQIETPTTAQQSLNKDGVTVYQIPVVVHIVHNGEAEGVETNISDSQILSQIAVLNKDFRKLNADSVNIPTAFKSFYSDIGFEFVMAKRDPNNQATNGITRIHGSQASWNLNPSDNTELKSHDYWPSEDYLNIWVAPLCCSWLGWAQFPQSDILEGLDPPYNATTDGIVITFNAFGSSAEDPSANLQPDFNLGRTATHEIGHFFGLRHIWGDGGCGVDDFITDTPSAESSYAGCPSLGTSTTSCGSQDMFMNYMDYVHDDCMNLFSTGQKDRMLIIMDNSPRRLSLTNSAGLLPPNSEDMALTKIISPTLGICDDQLDIILEVKNTGILPLTSTNISVYINGNLVTNIDFSINLTVNQTTELTFSSIMLTEYGNLNFKAEINSINGSIDAFGYNNIITQNSLRAETVSNLTENFSTNNAQWTVRTSETTSALNKKQAIFYTVSNNAAVFNYYDIESGSDAYISPKLMLGLTPKILLFDYAYAFRNSDDELSVTISTDCGNTFNDVLFISNGESLATSASVPVAFYPSKPLDWQHVQIDLSGYSNQEAIFSFKGISNGGNQIFLDNILVVDNLHNDIALVGLSSPSASCKSQNEVVLWVENKGSIQLSDLSIETILKDTVATINYPQINLMPGERISILLPTKTFQGTAELTVSIATDDNNLNNSFTQTIVSSSNLKQVPLREKFDPNQLPENWFLISASTNTSSEWSVFENKLEFIATNSISKGLASSIILPPLNLSNLTSASMHFDFAYAYNGFNQELLRINVSKDCGQTSQTLFVEGGEELATSFTTTPWLPSTSSDWKSIYIDLTEFTGNNNVQIVIELVSAQGNNAFIDNIELYASNILNPLELAESSITAYPNPSTNGVVNISFNLTQQQPAKLLIYNSQGRFIVEKEIENALNQTVEITTSQLQNGIYFARLIGSNIDLSKSFIISQ